MNATDSRRYWWAWWVNIDPQTGRLDKGCWGCKESESELVAEMAKRGKGRNEYEVYVSPHYGEARVKHELNDMITQKVASIYQGRAIDKVIRARYRNHDKEQKRG